MRRDDEDEVSEKIRDRLPTVEELRNVRQLLEESRRNKWLFTNLRIWGAVAVSALMFFASGSFDSVKQFLKRIIL
jgi:hypothetical protein